MNKIFPKILLISALAVILLHALIPHPHAGELSEREHVKIHDFSKSLYSILRVAFHESDDESLDNLFVVQNQANEKFKKHHLYPTIAIVCLRFTAISNKQFKKIANRNITNFNKLFIVNLNGVRGPPFSA